MFSLWELRSYVAMCQTALEKESPLEKIEALKRVKIFMYGDVRDMVINAERDYKWLELWHWAVYEFWMFGSWRDVFGLYKEIDGREITEISGFDDITKWIDDVLSQKNGLEMLLTSIGPGTEYFDEFAEMNPDIRPPYRIGEKGEPHIMTLMDILFCEICALWEGEVRWLARIAAVDGKAAEWNLDRPSMWQYRDMNFVLSIAAEMKLESGESVEGEAEKINWLKADEEHKETAPGEENRATLLARGDYDGAKLLRVCRRLKQEGYLDCKDEDWLYVWGVRTNPLTDEPLNPPAQPLAWSVEKGKKSALATTIATLRDNRNCGK